MIEPSLSPQNKCRICKENSTYDQPDNEYTFYCQTCKVCSVCRNFGDPKNNDSMTLQELEFAAKYKVQSAHFLCMAEGMKKEIEEAPQSISAKHLDWLNSLHLIFHVNSDLSKESNIIEATYASQRWLIDKSPEEIYLTLKRTEAFTAALSIALKRDRRSVELKLEAKEKEKFAAAASKQDSATRTQSPNRTEKKTMSRRDKVIETWMKLGMSYEDAAAAFDKAQKIGV